MIVREKTWWKKTVCVKLVCEGLEGIGECVCETRVEAREGDFLGGTKKKIGYSACVCV